VIHGCASFHQKVYVSAIRSAAAAAAAAAAETM